MSNFTRAWNESSPAGTDDATQGDDEIRNFKVEVSDRLKTLIYGFIAGEDTDAPGVKNLIFKQQAAAPGTPNADEIELYALDDGANCGLYAKQEDGYTKQILKKVGTDIQLNVEAGDYVADSIDADDIRLANETNLTARNAADNGDINILRVGSDGYIYFGVRAILQDLSQLATSAAPTSYEHLVNKKYVDDQDTADHPAYSGGESHTDGSGLIVKSGFITWAAEATPVTFAVPFPTAIISLNVTQKDGTSDYGAFVKSVSTSGFTIQRDAGGYPSGYYWTARGH